jgi:iron-sulfur cluster assembly protein
MVTVTDIAAEKIKELRDKEGLSNNYNVRVAVQGGGCSGLMYDLDFASEPQANDMVFEDKGVKIMIDKKSILYLAGTELDFSDGLNGKGFQFKTLTQLVLVVAVKVLQYNI